MKPPTTKQLLTEIRDALWKLNGDERLKGMERDIQLLKGNRDQTDKRLKALTSHLNLEYFEGERGYKKKHGQNKKAKVS